MWNRRALLWVIPALLVAGCNDRKSPTAPEVDPDPTGPEVVEVFSGSFGQLGSACHQFSTLEKANTQFSILSLAPVPTLTVGLGVGLPDPTAMPPCAITSGDSSVRVGEAFVSYLDPGTYCTCISDVGNVFPGATVDYELEVRHY